MFNIGKKTKLGYTLIELSVVMGVLVVVGGIIVGIIYATIQGSSKSKITSDIAQNGNYTLSVITNLLVNSQRFESLSSSGSSTIITECSVTGDTGDTLIVFDFDNNPITLSCNTTTGIISSNSASLIDSSRVKVTACNFRCSQQDPYSPPRIDVSFTLKNSKGFNASSTGSSDFSTSVLLRNKGLR